MKPNQPVRGTDQFESVPSPPFVRALQAMKKSHHLESAFAALQPVSRQWATTARPWWLLFPTDRQNEVCQQDCRRPVPTERRIFAKESGTVVRATRDARKQKELPLREAADGWQIVRASCYLSDRSFEFTRQKNRALKGRPPDLSVKALP